MSSIHSKGWYKGMEKLFSAQDVADRWSVKKDFVLKRASEKWVGLQLPYIKMGRAKRFRLEEVQSFERFHEGRQGKEEPITGIHLE